MTFKKKIKNNSLIVYFLWPFILLRKYYLSKKYKKKEIQLARFLKNVNNKTININVEEFGGNFEVNINSDLFKRFVILGEYEKEITFLLKKYIKPQFDVLDIGANIGFFSVFSSKLVNEKCKVLAVEPTPGCLTLFKENIKKNLGRNDLCFCESKKKYKHCHGKIL